MSLPQLIPLPEAARKLGLSETELRQRVETGTILAGNLPNGEIVVSTDNVISGVLDINSRLRAIRRKDFEHLRGQPITVTEAVEKYGAKFGSNLIGQTIRDWVKKDYIQVLRESVGRGSYMELDEADIAYCAAIQSVRKQAGVRTGFPLLDETGRPGLLKHPNLSRYRREQRQSDLAVA